ncbi:MAG: peptidylprolyl isomerase [Verrucomicrobiota bacterium]
MPISINGFTVPDEAIQREAERMLKEVQQNMPWLDENAARFQAEDIAKDRIIEHRLLFEEAQASIPDSTTEELNAIFEDVAKRHGGEKKFLKKYELQANQIPGVKKELEQEAKLDRLLAQLNSKVSEPTDQEIESFYHSNAKHFTSPDQYKASHIVLHTNQGQDPVEAKAKAEDCLASLESDAATFEQLADEVSDCPGKGGDLGWFPAGQMVEEFEKEVFPLEVGQRTGVFQTPFGFHIARLDDKKPGELQAFEQVSPQIKKHLATEARNQILEAKIDELKAKAEIKR